MASPSGLLEYVVRVRAKRSVSELTWSHQRAVFAAAECSLPEPENEMSQRVWKSATGTRGKRPRELTKPGTKLRQPDVA